MTSDLMFSGILAMFILLCLTVHLLSAMERKAEKRFDQKVYSQLERGKLLHMVVRGDRVKKGRTDVVHSSQFIQCAMLRLEKGTTFKPHQHIWKQRDMLAIAQESWIIIQGSVRCHFFDLNGDHICDIDIFQGDASFTFEGGHNYTILENNTRIAEYKTGPYLGQEHDKTFL